MVLQLQPSLGSHLSSHAAGHMQNRRNLRTVCSSPYENSLILIIIPSTNVAEPVGVFEFKLLNSESSPIITSTVEIPLAAGHGCFKAKVTEWSQGTYCWKLLVGVFFFPCPPLFLHHIKSAGYI